MPKASKHNKKLLISRTIDLPLVRGGSINKNVTYKMGIPDNIPIGLNIKYATIMPRFDPRYSTTWSLRKGLKRFFFISLNFSCPTTLLSSVIIYIYILKSSFFCFNYFGTCIFAKKLFLVIIYISILFSRKNTYEQWIRYRGIMK